MGQLRVAGLVEEEGVGPAPCGRQGVVEVEVAGVPDHFLGPLWAETEDVQVGSVWARGLPG